MLHSTTLRRIAATRPTALRAPHASWSRTSTTSPSRSSSMRFTTAPARAKRGTPPIRRSITFTPSADNPTYYPLTADMQFSWDNTGVGGNFNTYNTIAQDLIVDLLAYWRDAIGI